ncbi:MAG: alpha/beta hydrolase [Bryobacterales bacterium]
MSTPRGPLRCFTCLPLTLVVLLLASCSPREAASTSADPAGPASAFATYEGKQVHYLDTAGPGTALILVHGWACDSRVWEAQLESLASRARVIAVDLPAHGKSEIPDSELSMDLFARATAAVMDHAGVEQAVLVGHSNGTPVIRQFYRLFPERTRALVVVDGALRQMLNDEIIEQMKPRLTKQNYRETVAGFIDGMAGNGLDEASRAGIKTMALRQPHAAVYGGLIAAADAKVWEPDPIETPLLLILAEQPSWNEDYFDFVKQLAPQAEIHILPGVSHFIMTERPEEFDSLLTAFLESHNILEPSPRQTL